jgi:iron complex outermembrane recepter protein
MKQINEDTITYVYKENISTSGNMGISVNANFNVTKWWSTNLYTNVFHNSYKGIISAKPLDVAITTAMIKVSNQFKFNDGWSAELGGFYRTKGIEGQITVKALGQLNAGIQKQILKEKGTLKLSVRDALYTMPFDATFMFHDIDVLIKQKRDSRSVGLTFTYRFGNSNLQSRRLQSGAEDEQTRVKKGGSGN